MTAIFGYISDNLEPNILSMFLASDGLVVWHGEKGDYSQTDYKKVFRVNNFLIAFNGEVQFYETFLDSIRQISDGASCIQELQNSINDIFPFEKFGENTGIYSKAKYSNIIILDIENRVLAHHFAGWVSNLNRFYFPFDFQFLKKNVLYHFGSKASFLNELCNENNAFFIENNDLIKPSFLGQIEVWKTSFKEANEIYGGVGKLNSFFAIEDDKIEFSSNLGDLKQ